MVQLSGISPIKRNIFWSFIGQGVLIVLSLIATRFIYTQLGAEVLGILNFSIIVSSLFLTFTDMGMSLVVGREVAAFRNKDRQYVVQLAGMVSLISWISFFALSLFVVVISPWLVKFWLHFENLQPALIVPAFQIIVISMLIAIPRVMYGAVISGFERVDLVNLAVVLSMGVQQAGLIILLNFGGDLWSVAYWYGVSGVIGLLVYVVILAKVGGREFLLPKFNLSVIQRNAYWGIQVFGNSFLDHILTQADRWIVGKLLSVSSLGYYGFIHGLIAKGSMVPNAIATATFPSLVANIGEDSKAAGILRYEKVQDLCCYLVVPISAAVGLMGLIVIRLVFDELIVVQLWLAVEFLAIGFFIKGIVNIPQMLAVAMKRPDISLRTNFLSIVFILPPSIWLTYQFGLSGAAFSAILYGFFQILHFIPKFCRECLGASPKQWYIHTLGFGCMGLLTYGVPWGLAWKNGLGLEPEWLVASYLTGTLSFLLVAWFALGQELQKSLWESMAQFIYLLKNSSK